MSDNRTAEIRLFGAFRKHFPDGYLTIDMPTSLTAGQLRELLTERLTRIKGQDLAQLVSESALADDIHLLKDTELVDGTSLLALLPPVCGG